MNLTAISRYISLILRHKPEVIGIRLDEHGWADVDPSQSGPLHPRGCGADPGHAAGNSLAWYR